MALQHYLPATYLASFSLDSDTRPRRQRMLVAGDKKRLVCFRAPAAKLGAIDDLYTLTPGRGPADLVDQTWNKYESLLSEAIEELVGGTVSAITWARTLVPFVACTLVRGIDFASRFEARLPPGAPFRKNSQNTNEARLVELQRLLSPVLAAEWRILKAQGPGDLVVGDIGWAPAGTVHTGRLGIAIPLDRRHVLLLEPTRTRSVLRFDAGSWRPNIQYATLDLGSHLGLAEVLARYANRFLFGPDEETVKRYLSQVRATRIPEPWQTGFISPSLARVHEFTWHRLISMLELASHNPEQNSFELDFEALARGWCPRIFFPTNLPEFAPALARVGSEVVVHFYDVSKEVLLAAREFATRRQVTIKS